MLSTKFQVNWPFSSGEEAQNRFQNSGHDSHLGFPIRKILAILNLHDLSTCHDDASHQVLSQLAFQFRRIGEKIDFQDIHNDSHFGFPIGKSVGLSVKEK